MKKLLLVLSISFATSAFAQTDTDGVKLAALDYIHAFYHGDTVKLRRSVAEDAYKIGYSRPKDSAYFKGVQQMTPQQMINYVRNVASRPPHPDLNKWPQEVQVLDVADKIGAAKVTAWWGIDYLLMEKNTSGKWIIKQVMWQSPPRK